jgi:5,5'-dehydrodivanillate O-demethylase
MSEVKSVHPMTQKFALLSQTGPSTDMGKLLRRFWHPVAVASTIVKQRARPIRILGEALTLYRGESGKPYLVGGRCAHRLSLLHTGWVEGEEIRCIYHGWKYDGTGQCTQRPAEEDQKLPNVRVEGYPVREYGGLVFAYMGPGEPPEFDLPRKAPFEVPGATLFARSEKWGCNWFQCVENSLDAVHVSFVHQAGVVGAFGQAVSASIPKLEYQETDAGIRQIAARDSNVRISNWTFPNHNNIVIPGLKPEDPWLNIGVWMVPHDDTSMSRFYIYSLPPSSDDVRERVTRHMEKHGGYNPADHHDELYEGNYPTDPIIELTSAQDYVATLGQDVDVDRTRERLGKSDVGVAFLRRIFWRELELIREGRPTKAWRRLTDVGQLQIMKSEAASA